MVNTLLKSIGSQSKVLSPSELIAPDFKGLLGVLDTTDSFIEAKI